MERNSKFMQVKAFGLQLVPCPEIGYSALWNALETHSTKQLSALGRFLSGNDQEMDESIKDGKILTIADYEGSYKAGILIKVRDAKSFFQVQGTGKQMKISAYKLDKQTKQTEINFFLFNESNGKGLYGYYHLSSHMNDLCVMAKRIHEHLLHKRREELQTDLNSGKITHRELKTKRGDLSQLKYVLMSRSGSIPDLIKEMDRIKKIKISFEDWDAHTKGDMTPIMRIAKHSNIEMSFDSNSNVGAIQDWITNIVHSGRKIRRLRAEGTDASDLDQVINLERNLEDFNRVDYNAIADATAVDLSDISTSWKSSPTFKWLKATIEDPKVKKRFLG